MELANNLIEKPGLRKGFLVISFLLCFIGAVLSLYATNLTIQLAKHRSSKWRHL